MCSAHHCPSTPGHTVWLTRLRSPCGRHRSRADADEGPPQPKGEAGNGNDCPTGTQFPVPFPYGYGMHLWYNKEDGPSRDMWAIVDQVQVPNTTGEFVLRWRWVRGLTHACWYTCGQHSVDVDLAHVYIAG